MDQKTLQSVLVKPAGPDCNLRCGYCFYLSKSEMFGHTKTHRMSLNTLEKVIRQVMTQGPAQVSFGWQGGEPTLMGLPFFEKVVAYQQKYGRNQAVGNGLQTNGLLINEKWARFLKSYNFLVGLSIDGPEEIHDHYRTFSGGEGSWAKAVDRAKLLLDAGVAVNVLTVINDYSVNFPEEIYQFHKNLGFEYMQFIPCIELDPADPARLAPFSISAEKYGHFLCSLFDLWRADFNHGQPTTSIRYFDSLLHCYLKVDAPECTMKQTCGDYLVIEHNGDVYSCDFFVDPAWRLGNVDTGLLSDMLNSPRQQLFGKQKGVLDTQCRSCRWLTYCYGGCPKDRLSNPENHNITPFCQAYQLVFEHADAELRRLARQQMQAPIANGPPHHGEQPRNPKIGRNHACPCGSGRKYKKCCGNV